MLTSRTSQVSFATFASVLTIYLSASTSVISGKDSKGDKSSLGLEASDFPHLPSEDRVRLPRSASVRSYGSINFSPRPLSTSRPRFSGRGHSASNSIDTPFLAHSLVEEDGDDGSKTPVTGKQAFVTQNVATRKVMYFAAGSGIPEIKTLLSGFVIRGYLGTL